VSGTESRRGGLGLTLKVFAATALVVVAVLAAALAVTAAVARTSAERALDQRLSNTSEVLRRFIEAENGKLARGAMAAAQFSPSVAAIVSGDAATALDQAQVYREILGADYTLITDNQAVLKARTDRPGAFGDTLGGPLIGGALEGRQVSGFVNQADERLYLAVATPLADQESGVVRAMLLAAHQVTDSLAAQLRRATGSDVVFFVLDAEDRPVVVAASLPRSPALDAAVRPAVSAGAMTVGSAETRTEAVVEGRRLAGFLRPLVNPGVDRAMGGYLALRSLDAELASFRRLQRTLGIVGAAGLLVALLAAWVVARQIARPVRALVAATRRVADGDLGGDVPVAGRDEIGQLAGAFRHMLEELRAKQQLVEFLSSGAGAATERIPLAGGEAAVPTLVRAAAAGTGMLAVGQTFAGRYEVKAILGIGGMGVVYRALDRELGEPVAIKTLKADAVAADPAMLQRFKDEIRLARRITHRNVVRTHDLGEVEGLYYITMEYVEGQSLKHLVQSRGHLPVSVTLTLGKQLCRALEVAHEQGVIHRDIKPQNMIVEPSGTLKVMDFGIARLAARTDGVTQAGMAIGTPEYMAPEQLLGDQVDFRADLYATGCVLFECLTGRPPFVADSPVTLVAKQLEEVPPSPAALNAEVPPALADLVLRALSKDREQRPASATVLHDALDAIAV
jgi:serine/threonine-protein kinase